MTKPEDIQRAIDDFKKLDPEPGKPVTERGMVEYEMDCLTYAILNYELTLTALEHYKAAQEVDVEGLYKDHKKFKDDYAMAWNDCIDHLQAKGYIGKPLGENEEAIRLYDNLIKDAKEIQVVCPDTNEMKAAMEVKKICYPESLSFIRDALTGNLPQPPEGEDE